MYLKIYTMRLRSKKKSNECGAFLATSALAHEYIKQYTRSNPKFIFLPM